MGDLLLPTRGRVQPHFNELLTPSKLPPAQPDSQEASVHSLEDVLKILRSSPSTQTLTACLKWLLAPEFVEGVHFNIHVPGARASEVVNVLVNTIVPDFWQTIRQSSLKNERRARKLLLNCLRSLAGVNGVVARLRRLLEEQRSSSSTGNTAKSKARPSGLSESLVEALKVLENLIDQDSFVTAIWSILHAAVKDPGRRNLVWKEFVSLVGSGKLVSVAAEASHVRNRQSLNVEEESWIGNGSLYGSWLGRNILWLLQNNQSFEDATSDAARLFSKSLSLGYSGTNGFRFRSWCPADLRLRFNRESPF